MRESRIWVMSAVVAGWLAVWTIAAFASPVSPFATKVVDEPPWGGIVNFRPAPGQFVNSVDPPHGNPAQALGAPNGAGIHNPSYAIVSLGGFGGSLTLKFDHTIKNDPNNPFGLDAIVYGNGFWQGRNPKMKWQEPGVIEISKDANGNGIADDTWYVIKGSHTPAVPSSLWMTEEYDKTDAAYLPSDKAVYPDNSSAYGMAYYPSYADHISLSGYQIPSALSGSHTNPNTNGAEEVWGYADCSPSLFLGDMDANDSRDDLSITSEEFFTTPDDPKATGMTPGSGGGDAFDIAWAKDAAGNSANLDGFDFIRITTGPDVWTEDYGEMSTEIDAVADASPSPQQVRAIKVYPNGTGARLLNAVVTAAFSGEFYVQDEQVSGIKVKSSTTVASGDRVNVIGEIRLAGTERQICSLDRNGATQDAFIRLVDQAGVVPDPVGMPNSRLGGGAFYTYTPGVTDGNGLNNIGLLVKTGGRVISRGTGYFYINDGSLPDGKPLKVTGSLTLQNPKYVIVTGICSCEQVGQEVRRVVKTRQQTDILEF